LAIASSSEITPSGCPSSLMTLTVADFISLLILKSLVI
jgi:hypothetical protein